MIDLDLKDVDELEHELKTFAKRSYPFATKQALNASAWGARKRIQDRIGIDFVERNRWTRGSIRVEQTRTLNIRNQAAAVGSTESYMESQEFGDVEQARGKHGVPIPTPYSAGQEGQRPRTKLPRRSNRLANIRFNRGGSRGKTAKQRVLFAVRAAVQSGRRFAFMDFGGGKSKGIMRVLGGRKGSKRGWPKGARLKMIYSLAKRSVRIPATPWLGPAVDAELPAMQEHFRKALIFQMKRQKLGVSSSS